MLISCAIAHAGFSDTLEHLEDYWKLEPHKPGEANFCYYADGTAHKNRMQGNDFVRSLMHPHGVTCFDCHGVHGTSYPFELKKPPDGMCAGCHAPNSENGPYMATIGAHTHHKQGSSGSSYIACHMPMIETEGVPEQYVHSHTFAFTSRAMTVKYGMPNPCTSRHQHKTNGWAMNWLKRWYSPMRTE